MERNIKNIKKSFEIGVFIIILGCALGAITVLDNALALSIVLLIFLSLVTFFLLHFQRFKERNLYQLFLIVILIHFGLVLFLHYTQFYPFGGGRDDLFYHQTAVQITERFKEGNFSLSGIDIPHWYPVFLGALYSITLPDMLIGKSICCIWLAGISAVLTYLIVREIGCSKKWAFITGLFLSSAYSSYLFYGSLLLKDTLIVPLVLFGLLLIIRLLSSFNWKNFIIFIIVFGVLITLRFYTGVVLLFTFILSYFFVSKTRISKKIIYSIIIILVLGFAAQFLGYGFLGINQIKNLMSPESIASFRETGYSHGESATHIEADFNGPLSFLKYYIPSFLNALFAPFPWQMRSFTYIFSFIEIIPWYFIFFFALKGFKNNFHFNKRILPLFIFGFGLIAAVALFSDNLGANMRLRMAAFFSFGCLAPLGFQKKYDERQGQKA